MASPPSPPADLEQHFTKDEASGHCTAYLAAGPVAGPLCIFVHGWPELSFSWRHQLRCLASLGFRTVAPDMRGYGKSSTYKEHASFRQELIVADMLALLRALGREQAVWIGHDWGSAVVWNVATHHPEACIAVANLCVPFNTLDRGLDRAVHLVDRSLYPVAEFPFGQWSYMRFYEEHFAEATAAFEADVSRSCKALFRAGSPELATQPSRTAHVLANGGWFPVDAQTGVRMAPDVPRDEKVLSEEELQVYVSSLQSKGFFGPDSWYMNSAANVAYAERVCPGLADPAAEPEGYRLSMPVLFVAASYDAVCSPELARRSGMEARCDNFSWAEVASGHWMAQERPAEVNAVLLRWLATKVPEHWPLPEPPANPPPKRQRRAAL